ncbi:MAG: CvpA family protein [Bacteroidetes bacterium]|nr:CvpA family protein [Bacteroidota bacterium]
MTLDIIIAIPILIAILLGFRDGFVRKIFSLGFIVLGLYIAQITQHQLGKTLLAIGISSPENAPSRAFNIVFWGVLILQMLLYRLALGKYKVGGVADRIVGAVLGFIQGVIIMSTILMVLATHGSPRRTLTRDSKLYKSIVNVAPQILDIITIVSDETTKAIKTIESHLPEDEDATPKSDQQRKKNPPTK